MSRCPVALAVASFLLAGSLSPVLADDPRAAVAQPPGPCCEDDCCLSPCVDYPWEARVGFVWLQRNRLPSRELVHEDALVSPQSINADQFHFDFEGGPDVTLLRHGERADIEFRWFQVHDWVESLPTLSSADGWGLRYRTTNGPDVASDVSARYLTELNNFELNVKKPLSDRIKVLGGFRFLELNDLLEVNFQEGLPYNSHTSVQSFNDLYGFQVGTEVNAWDRGGPFHLDVYGKVGLYDNFARNSALLYIDSDLNPGHDAASTHHTAFVGELGIIGVYQLTPRLAARFGYQLLWLDGVALGSEQMGRLDPFDPTSTTGASVSTAGTAFYHGVVSSLGYSW